MIPNVIKGFSPADDLGARSVRPLMPPLMALWVESRRLLFAVYSQKTVVQLLRGYFRIGRDSLSGAHIRGRVCAGRPSVCCVIGIWSMITNGSEYEVVQKDLDFVATRHK